MKIELRTVKTMLEYLRNNLNIELRNLPPYYNLKFLINNLKILGSWPPLEGPKKAYVIRSVITLSLTLGHLLFVQTAFIVAGCGDTEKIASAVFLLINNYVHAFKVFVIFRYQKRIHRMLVHAEAKEFTCENFETLKKVQQKYSRAGFMHYGIFQLGGIFASTMWILSSVIHGLKRENDRVLPMNAWYPYDALTTPMYEITVIFQGLAVYGVCIHNISLDGLIIGFMTVIGCEFEIFKTKVKKIGENKIEELGVTEYNEINALKDVDIDNELYEELMLCVKHHIAIIEYATEFLNIFGLVIFLQFLENCFVICMTAFALAQLQEYNLTTVLGNLMYLMAIIYQLFMYCYFGNVISVQVFNILWHQDRIIGLLEIASGEKFNRYNLQYRSILNSYTMKGVFHHVAYQSLGTVAVFCWGLTPIASIIAGQSRRLPMEGWYPYNTTKTPAFELTCVHQTVAAVIACFHNIAMDTLVTGLMTVVSCQFEILKLNLHRIGIEKYSQSPTARNAVQVELSESELNSLVKHHNAIIDDIYSFAKEIEAVFGITIFVQFLINCIIICLAAFHISKIRVFIPAELIGMTMYMCCMTYQIFIYSWHGNEIVLQSESVVVAAFAGNWWLCGERYKRGLRLLMVRANRPLTLKAGNLLTLSLQTFVTILRASYSFFTVLQSSTDKTQA